MRRSLLVLSLLSLAALLVACSPKAGPGLALASAPWKEGEQVTYDVVGKDGQSLGSESIAFAQEGDTWLLTVTDKIGELEQTAAVRIAAGSLKPLGEEKTIRAPGADVTLSTTYAGARLEIRAVVNGENRSAAIDVPTGALDNDQLLMTLRALQFAEGYQGRYVNVVAANAARVNTTVRVTGKETIEVPAGTFEAWRVELDFGQARQYAWYQVAPPYQMVQYDNGAQRFVLQGAQ